jgi:hypothetical protein
LTQADGFGTPYVTEASGFFFFSKVERLALTVGFPAVTMPGVGVVGAGAGVRVGLRVGAERDAVDVTAGRPVDDDRVRGTHAVQPVPLRDQPRRPAEGDLDRRRVILRDRRDLRRRRRGRRRQRDHAEHAEHDGAAQRHGLQDPATKSSGQRLLLIGRSC